MKLIIPIIVICVFFASCKKDNSISTINMGYNYFPLDVGSWIIYDVDSIVHNTNTNETDSFFYQIKEVVESQFTDSEGNKSYRIERYKRANPTNNWSVKDVWSAYVLTSQALKTEENIKYIKLIFPVVKDKNWNGTAYASIENLDFNYSEVDIKDTINQVVYDSVLHVLQFEDSNFIEYKLKKEKYARGIGLIQKQDIYLDYQTNGGYEYTERINSFGK